MVNHGASSIPVAILACFVTGLVCGFINGILISTFDLQPFLVTMGTMQLYRGIDYIYSGALSIRGLPQEFIDGMNSTNSTIPVPVIFLIIIAVFIVFVMKKTRFGRYVFAIGGNEEATRLSGIPVKKYKVSIYIIMGLLASLCGLIYLGRLSAADANAGSGYELDAIAAAAIGGASLSGGKGSIGGTIMGALMLAMLANGLTLLKVQAFYQVAATGLIIIIAVLIDKFSN